MVPLPNIAYSNLTENGEARLWDSHQLLAQIQDSVSDMSLRTLERTINDQALVPAPLKVADVRDNHGAAPNRLVLEDLQATAKRQRRPSLVLQLHRNARGYVLMANDGRQARKWLSFETRPGESELTLFLRLLGRAYNKPLLVWPHGEALPLARELVDTFKSNTLKLEEGAIVQLATTAYRSSVSLKPDQHNKQKSTETIMDMTHLDRLEAESMHIIREVMAESENPVMLYSIGKDSAVMLRLAQKAFYPSKPPFPLLHVDTRWKFQAMYEFRQRIAEETGMELLVHINPEGVEKNINPFDHGSALHTDIMKTQSLKMALDKYQFDVAFGGARRDEEKSRAKERVFSFRTDAHRWDPKNQRPELWSLYNGRKNKGESIRVFPLSNWTELDIWQYIYREDIPIVPLYYAAERPVIERDGMLMMVDDDRLQLFPGEKIETKRVRFRTLGCYPLTGAIESDADDLPKILLELLEARTSERQGRAIDKDSSGSMEKKKQEGYF